MDDRDKYRIWKHIDGTADIEVSNFGEVRSAGGYVYTQTETIYGYKMVKIIIDGKKQRKTVHRLVAEAFVENPFNKKEVNHKNGDKSNNCQWNLEWTTSMENQMHRRYVLGKNPSGDNSPLKGRTKEVIAKYKDWVLAVREDGSIFGRYSSQKEAAIAITGETKITDQLSRCLSRHRNCRRCRGLYWMYEKEYNRMIKADLKPCELLEHPEVWSPTYRGQSAAKPQGNKY